MDENKKLNEEQLNEVVGGNILKLFKNCDFTPTGETKDDGTDVWAKCASDCGFAEFRCTCHKQAHCIDKWHRLHSRTGELDPREFANHANKPKSNNYNT